MFLDCFVPDIHPEAMGLTEAVTDCLAANLAADHEHNTPDRYRRNTAAESSQNSRCFRGDRLIMQMSEFIW
jgi:hypothetical protein